MSTQIVQQLKENTPYLKNQGFTYLGLFGSYSRGEETQSSDVDLMFEFEKPKSFFELADIKLSLEEVLGRKVDLVSRKSVKDNLKPFISKDIIKIYEKE